MTTTAMNGRTRWRRTVLRRTATGWTFLLPNFVGFALLTLVPIVALFYLSFTDWNVFGKANWVGLANFRRLMHDDSFRAALKNTLYYTIFAVPLTFAASLGLALLLNRQMRGVGFFRTAAFFPYITSIVAIAAVWNMMLSPDLGPVNHLLRVIGWSHPPGWSTSTHWAMPTVILVGIWRYMGYFMLLFLAGLQTVPPELHDAARVDGASAWQRFRHVTMPCLRPTTFFVLVILTIWSLKVFDIIFVMTGGGPGQSTLVLSQYIYKTGFQNSEFGYASAVSVALFVLCILITAGQFAWNRRQTR